MRLGLLIPTGTRNVLTVNAFIEHTQQLIADWGYPGLTVAPAP